MFEAMKIVADVRGQTALSNVEDISLAQSACLVSIVFQR
jgi:hypothetical protein